MYSCVHVPEGQGSALREIEWQDSSHDLEQDCHYIQELECTSLDFKACSFQEGKKKQLSHCDIIGYDEPPKPKGKKKKTLGPHSASSYSSTHDYHFPQQQFQLNHGFGISLYEPHLPRQPSESLSFLGLNSVSGMSRSRESGTSRSRESGTSRSRESGTSRSRESGTSRSRESGTSRSRESGTSRSRESGTSRSREPGTSRSRESGTSRSRESGTSRSRESGTSRESSPYKSEQQRKHQRTKEAIKVAVKHNAAMEAPYIVEALVNSIQSSYSKGQLDMTEAREQLLSSGKSLLYAAAQAYCRSESSPEVIRKLSLALDKCSHLSPLLQLLANIISFHNVKRVIEILKFMFDGKIGMVDGCTQIFDLLGRSACRYCGCSIGAWVGGIVGGVVGCAFGGAGGAGGAMIGAGIGAWAGEKLGNSMWELIKKAIGYIKKAIGYIINYIWSLLDWCCDQTQKLLKVINHCTVFAL